jgi:zinc protease
MFDRGRRASIRNVLLLCACVSTALLFLPAGGSAENGPVRRVLPNGMTVILKENHAAPVVSIQVWVKAGSVQEKDEEAGVAHVHEHMLFKGTKSRGVGTIARDVEAAGGEINAYTSWETTVYFVNMASRFKKEGIEILADIVENATFDEQELAKEIEVIREEIRRSMDMPSRRLSDTFYATAYGVHPYGRPVIGYDEIVKGFTREDVLRFYRNWYVPENLVWVMVGDLDPEALMPELEKRLSRIPNRPLPVQKIAVEPPQSAPRVFVQQEDAKEARLKIGFHIPGISDPDVPALDLLAQILGQGRSSRLYSSLRMERRLVNSISAYSMTPKDPGLFLVSSSLEAEDLDRALTGILEETFRVCFEPVTIQELKKAKTQIQSDFIYQKQTVQGQARELGYYEAIVGDLGFGEKYLDRLRTVRAEDVMRVARTYLRPQNLTLGALIPNTEKDRISKKKLLEQVTRTYKSTEARFATRAGGTPEADNPVLKVRLSNGATLLVKENRAVPLVSFRAVFLGGLLSEDENDNGISNFLAHMLNKGTEKMSAEEIAEEVESLAGSVSGFSGMDSFGLSGETVSWDFLPVFEIFSDILLHPTFPEEYVNKTRQDVLAAIKNQEDDLDHLAFRLLWKTLYPCHPYGMDVLGTLESVKGITREDLADYYRKHAVSQNLVLAIVGDIDRFEAKEVAEGFLMGVRNEPFLRSLEACDARPGQQAVQEVSEEKQQAHILVGARGARHSDPDKYSLDVLDAVLSGQGGRLFTQLRDEQSLAYSVTALNREAVQPGVFAVYMATSPDKRKTAIDGMIEQLRLVREEKIPEEEIERAKNYLIGTYEVGIQTNSAQASAMAFNELYGVGYAEYLEYPQRIKEVTAKQVRKAAEKYLCPDCLVEAEILPKNSQ